MAAKSLNGQHYRFQLTIKDLLTSPKISARNQEIVYRDKVRYTYSDLFERINRLGSALNSLGVKQGDTVAVFDYDSHRYLESFFGIPMLGAVLFTVNWRLSPDRSVHHKPCPGRCRVYQCRLSAFAGVHKGQTEDGKKGYSPQ